MLSIATDLGSETPFAGILGASRNISRVGLLILKLSRSYKKFFLLREVSTQTLCLSLIVDCSIYCSLMF